MATRYVDVDAAAGGDGTTNGLSGANCAYKSLSIWEAARQASLSEVETCICESSHASHTADTTSVAIDGWTTSSANYISIATSSGARHAGIWSDSKYRMVVAGTAIGVYEDYVRIEGLQVKNDTGTANSWKQIYVGLQTDGANDVRISTCLLVGHGHATYWNRGLEVANSADVTCWNCIFYGVAALNNYDNYAVVLGASDGTLALYGCTVIGGHSVIARTAGTLTAKNTYAGGCYSGNACYNGTITMVNCAAADTTASGTDPHDSVAYDTTTFVSVTPGNADYLKLTSGGGLTGHGATLTDDPPGSTALGVDIAGTTRS